MRRVMVDFVNETYAKGAGRWVYLYRAIDQFGQVIDVLVAEKRDLAATRRFFPAPLNTGRPQSRSPPIRRLPTHPCSTSWCLPPAMSPSNSETTRSKPITDG
jgi:hypothetical protein